MVIAVYREHYEMRRVVVTGLGAVTPLGVGMIPPLPHDLSSPFLHNIDTLFLGVRRTWKSLLDGKCGIVSTDSLGPEFQALPSRVAGLVPKGASKDGAWDAQEHVTATVRSLCACDGIGGLTASRREGKLRNLRTMGLQLLLKL